jgi:carbon storage regulator
MLVLSRNPGESIHIGDNIIITVLSIKNNQVRLGLEAPKDVQILRSELRSDGQGQAQAQAQVRFNTLASKGKLDQLETRFNTGSNSSRSKPRT